MAIKGSLGEAGLADVCQLLANGQKTGCLSVTDRSRFGQVYFDRGRITYATIVNRRDRLGDLLLRDGVVTREQLESAVQAQDREPERRIGEILLESGAIDADTLAAVIRRQIEDAIYYLFTWKRGSFHFEAERAPERSEILIAVNPETLLLEGARRVDEWSVIEKKVGSMDQVFELDEERLQASDAALTPEQDALVGLIDARRSVEDLAEAAGLDEFTTARALYGLVQAGFARRAAPAAREAASAEVVAEARNLGRAFYRTGMLEDAEREFRRVLDSDPHDAGARHALALIALRQDRPGEAARRLRSLLEIAGPRVSTFLNLAYALRRQGRYEDALRVLDSAASVSPDDPRVFLARGAVHLLAGDAARALSCFQEFTARVPDAADRPATYYHGAALAEAVRGRAELADALVQAGLSIHPASAPLHLLAGVLAGRGGDTAAAERAYRRAAEEDPRLPQPHRHLGDLALRRGVQTEAIEHYRRALEADPDLGPGTWTRFGDLYYRRGDREEAVRCWQRALALEPRYELARNRLEVAARAVG